MLRYQLASGVVIATVFLAVYTPLQAAETIKPHHAETIKPIQGGTIEPYRARPIEPIKAAPIKPSNGSPVRSGGAEPIRPVEAGVIKPIHAESMKPLKPAGIDPVLNPGPLDRKLIGTWEISIPGVAYQTERDRGAHVERTLRVGTGAGLGTLTINAHGEFRWVKNNVVSKGKLEQVLPRNFADPKQSYWRLNHGKDVYYIASESSGDLTFYSPRTNLYAASGKRQKKATTGK